MFRRLTALCTAGAIVWGGSMHAQNLAGSEWGPVELNAGTFAPVSDIFLRFEQDGRYFGNGGCNTFRGAFVTNDAAILFSPAAATMMACTQDIAKQEYDFLQALMSVREFERDGIALTLSNAEGMTVLKLQQRDAD